TLAAECLVRVVVLRDSIFATELVWKDTLPFFPQDIFFQKLPSEVMERARLCVEQFPPEKTPLREMWPTMELALLAGRDEVVKSLIAKRLAAVSDTSVQERAWVTDTIRAILERSR